MSTNPRVETEKKEWIDGNWRREVAGSRQFFIDSFPETLHACGEGGSITRNSTQGCLKEVFFRALCISRLDIS